MDPRITLAFSIHSNPGVYAVLAGSGLSRSAGVPTGWEVVLDLIRKIATLQSENCEPDPVAWYESKFKVKPSYSDLISRLSKTPAERSNLMRSYFEPTEDERERGIKVPSLAHREIAKLVKSGYVRVIITTNFDRLFERAIEEAGVTPTVISSPDAAEGALPLTHSKCTIIKVHSDYLDTRMKHTEAELSLYDDRINRLLDQVLDEYGLIVCGWSARWDIALRSAIERCKTHRFGMYWTHRSEPKDEEKTLIGVRRASVIPIKSADEFFSEISEKVSALETMAQPHPLSTKMSVETVKRYIPRKDDFIKLHDFVMRIGDELASNLNGLNFPFQIKREEFNDLFKRQIRQYEAVTSIPLATIITGCYWGTSDHHDIWIKLLERTMNARRSDAGMVPLIGLRLYPSLLLMFGAGIAAIAANRLDTLYAILSKPNIWLQDDQPKVPAISALHLWEVLNHDAMLLFFTNQRYTPASDHLFGVLREPFREIIPNDSEFEQIFDRFDYYAGLQFLHLSNGPAPIGRYGWRHRGRPTWIIQIVQSEYEKVGGNWPPLKAGLFGGDPQRFHKLKSAIDDQLTQFRH